MNLVNDQTNTVDALDIFLNRIHDPCDEDALRLLRGLCVVMCNLRNGPEHKIINLRADAPDRIVLEVDSDQLYVIRSAPTGPGLLIYNPKNAYVIVDGCAFDEKVVIVQGKAAAFCNEEMTLDQALDETVFKVGGFTNRDPKVMSASLL